MVIRIDSPRKNRCDSRKCSPAGALPTALNYLIGSIKTTQKMLEIKIAKFAKQNFRESTKSVDVNGS